VSALEGGPESKRSGDRVGVSSKGENTSRGSALAVPFDSFVIGRSADDNAGLWTSEKDERRSTCEEEKHEDDEDDG
jgi:hypothetical protein